MPVTQKSLFRVFEADYRNVLWQFFANRHDRITADLAVEFADSGTLRRMVGLELLEYDGNEYRLDDRIERFIEDMLGLLRVIIIRGQSEHTCRFPSNYYLAHMHGLTRPPTPHCFPTDLSWARHFQAQEHPRIAADGDSENMLRQSAGVRDVRPAQRCHHRCSTLRRK